VFRSQSLAVLVRYRQLIYNVSSESSKHVFPLPCGHLNHCDEPVLHIDNICKTLLVLSVCCYFLNPIFKIALFFPVCIVSTLIFAPLAHDALYMQYVITRKSV